MLPCHSCYIYKTYRIKEVGGLKSAYQGKLKGGKGKARWRRSGGGVAWGWGWAFYMGELTPQVFYQNYLPISVSFDLKRVL